MSFFIVLHNSETVRVSISGLVQFQWHIDPVHLIDWQHNPRKMLRYSQLFCPTYAENESLLYIYFFKIPSVTNIWTFMYAFVFGLIICLLLFWPNRIFYRLEADPYICPTVTQCRISVVLCSTPQLVMICLAALCAWLCEWCPANHGGKQSL